MTVDQWITAGIPSALVLLTFLRNEGAFASLNKRLDSIESRGNNLEANFNTRLNNLDRKIDETTNRLEGKIDKLSARVDSLWDRVLR